MSNQVAVVGGHGQVARHLHPLLRRGRPAAGRAGPQRRPARRARGARRPRPAAQHRAGERRGVRPRRSQGCDAVVFAAGGGPDGNIERKRTVDLEGALKSIEGARAAGHHPVRHGLGDRRRRAAPRRHRPGLEGVRRGEARRRRGAAAERPGLDDPAPRPAHRRRRPPAWSPSARTSTAARSRAPTSPPSSPPSSTTTGPSGKQWNLVGGQVPVAEAVSAAVDNG